MRTGGIALIVLIGLVALGLIVVPPLVEESRIEAPQVAAPEPAPDAAVADGPAADGSQAPEAAQAAEAARPEFDIVRVEPDGEALVAGSGPPGAEIIVLIDGKEAARVRADGGGSFVALFSAGLSARPRLLSLRALGPGGAEVRTTDTVILSPSPEALLAARAAEPDAGAGPEVVASLSAGVGAPETVPRAGGGRRSRGGGRRSGPERCARRCRNLRP